ncbi:MAG: hypothetical protein ACLGIO_12855 [Acidimicrobiia bacterium]
MRRSRPAGDDGSPRFSREDAEAEAAEELRRAMDRAGVPGPPAGVVAAPGAPAAEVEGEAGAEPGGAEAPRPAVRRVRKAPPGGAARRSGGPPARGA